MKDIIDSVIPFIIAQQESNGSFSTYESYPVVNPGAGWTLLPDPSPFITANILFSLLQVNDRRLQTVIDKGAHNLLATKEGAGFWRFWPVKSKQHPLPLDMDDTCMALAVLQRCGYNFNSRNILLNNKNAEGYFETWLHPRLSMLFTSPATAYSFFKDYQLARPTHQSGHFSYRDKEPAVAANVLLYLGENTHTQACIRQIVKEVKSSSLPRKFYDEDIVIFYHIARAYANGITGFKEVGEHIADTIKKQRMDDKCSVMLRAMAANILLDLEYDTSFAEELLQSIIQHEVYPAKWTTDAYFCSRDKNFLAGSPALSAAVFMEGCAKLNRIKAK